MQAPKCSNCGKRGHSIKLCQDPVMSYGLIAIRIRPSGPHETYNDICCSQSEKFEGISSIGNIEYLLIQRKDSIAFVEFVRGKYALDDMTYIIRLLMNMTMAERMRLGIDFDELWRSVWGDLPLRSYRNDYDNSKEKYGILLGSGKLMELLGAVPAIHSEPEWGFPKGRRNPGEDDMMCAMREFYEETGLSRHSYNIIKFMEPLEETFFGTNGVHYSHKYYIAICDPKQEVKMNVDNHHMVREIGNIGWFSLEEAMKRIRPENIEKREILLRAQSIFRNYIPVVDIWKGSTC